MPDTYDETTLKEVTEYITEIKQNYSKRNEIDNEIEAAVNFEWTKETPNKTGEEDIKLTISPMAANMANGAINLMIASKPTFSVPSEKNNAEAKQASSLLEQVAQAVWDLNGIIQQVPLENDLVTSGVMFGEVCGGVSSTKDMLEAAKGGSKAVVKRMEWIAETVPYFFEIWDPRTCYAAEDSYGLAAFVREVTMKSGQVIDRYGKDATEILGDKRYEDVVLQEFWDNEKKVVRIDGKEGVIKMGEHNLPIIPIVNQTVNGSRIYSKPAYRRKPFLYGLIKSGLWYRQSLALTVMFQNLFTLGAWPEFVFQGEPDSPGPSRDTTVPDTIRIGTNEKFTQLQKTPIDAGMKFGLETAMALGEESTMYKAALGQPPAGSNASFSMVSLLHQAGRLPLVPQQRRGSMGAAQFCKIMFTLWKDSGGSNKIQGSKGLLEMKATEIPESFILEANLDVSMPQDDRQNAQIFAQVTGGDVPGASVEWGRMNLLHIGQSDEMDKDIQRERINAAVATATTQIEIQKRLTAMQPQQPVAGAGNVPPGATTGAANQQQGIVDPQQAQMQQQQAQAAQQGAPQGLPPGIENMPPEQLQAMMDQQGIPPEQQQQILQAIQAKRQGPQNAQEGLPLTGPVQPPM
jgi:hypothetical protein